MPKKPSIAVALAILFVAAGSLGGAYIIQFAGYAPCELCLKERAPYYAGIALAGLALVLALQGRTAALPSLFTALAVVFAASAAFGAYHAGVEWGFWPGPQDCSGPLDHVPSVDDFLKRLQTVKVVRCDAPALTLFGLSLAAWNAAVSGGLAGLALLALRLRRG